jgi:hypothetical protein
MEAPVVVEAEQVQVVGLQHPQDKETLEEVLQVLTELLVAAVEPVPQDLLVLTQLVDQVDVV